MSSHGLRTDAGYPKVHIQLSNKISIETEQRKTIKQKINNVLVTTSDGHITAK